MKRSIPTRLSLAGVVALIALLIAVPASAGAAQTTWGTEFVKDLSAFRHHARSKTSLINEGPPIFGSQFQAYNVYSGELLAESRQLEWLEPPSSCESLQEETVERLRRMSGRAYGLGDAKDLTPYEYKRNSKELLTLPHRLTDAIMEARGC